MPVCVNLWPPSYFVHGHQVLPLEKGYANAREGIPEWQGEPRTGVVEAVSEESGSAEVRQGAGRSAWLLIQEGRSVAIPEDVARTELRGLLERVKELAAQGAKIGEANVKAIFIESYLRLLV